MFTTDPDAVIRIAPAEVAADASEYIELFLAQNLVPGTECSEGVFITDRDLKALVTKALLAGMAFEKDIFS